jgi:hypothetical protein
MSVTVEWFDTQERIVLLKMGKIWTLEELAPAVEKSRQLSGGVSHDKVVHTIVDLRDGSMSVPRSITSHFRRIVETQLPNAGITVTVTTSGFVHSLFKLTTRLSHNSVMAKIENHFIIVSTFEDAEHRIQTLIQNENMAES